MDNEAFKNPFVQKMRMLTQLLVVSISINIAFGATLFYHFAFENKRTFIHSELPEVTIRKEHSTLLQSFFGMSFDELVLELSNIQEISDGYKVSDLALAILSTYHYLDLSKALMGENLEEREVTFIHTDGGEQFPLCLYPDVQEHHYSLIKGFIKETKYPFTAEGLFAELKTKKEKSPTELVEAFMLTKEYIAIYTFANRFFETLPKEELVLMLIDGSYQDVERFYYLYLENMDKPKEMMRYFFKTYVRFNSPYACKMWTMIDEDYILHQLDNEELTLIVKQSTNESFLKKVYLSPRNSDIRNIAKQKLPEQPIIEEVVTKEESTNTAPQYTSYTVQKGDSFWKIAHKHGLTIGELKKHNKRDSDLLRPGQTLNIPASK